MNLLYLTSQDKFDKALVQLDKIKKLCIDTETTGLDARIADVRLIQVCSTEENDDDRDIYVFDMFKIPDHSKLKAFIESREMLVAHSMNFDFQFLLKIGIDYKNKIFDTYIAERCLRAGFKEKRISPQAKKPYFADVS